MWNTPAGFNFRELIDKWDNACIREAKHNQIRLLVDGQNFVLFFSYDKNIYAANESNRVTFSQMKHPDEETTKAWLDEAHFIAFNLSKGVMGKPSQDVFYKDDIDDINIISKDEAYDSLTKLADEMELAPIRMGAQTLLHFAKQNNDDPKNNQGIKLNQDKES